MMKIYAEYGAIGLICSLFAYMITSLIKSQKDQTDELIERWNRSDETSARHREDIVKELNDVTDDLSYLKGRINSKQ